VLLKYFLFIKFIRSWVHNPSSSQIWGLWTIICEQVYKLVNWSSRSREKFSSVHFFNLPVSWLLGWCSSSSSLCSWELCPWSRITANVKFQQIMKKVLFEQVCKFAKTKFTSSHFKFLKCELVNFVSSEKSASCDCWPQFGNSSRQVIREGSGREISWHMIQLRSWVSLQGSLFTSLQN